MAVCLHADIVYTARLPSDAALVQYTRDFPNPPEVLDGMLNLEKVLSKLNLMTDILLLL